MYKNEELFMSLLLDKLDGINKRIDELNHKIDEIREDMDIHDKFIRDYVVLIDIENSRIEKKINRMIEKMK